MSDQEPEIGQPAQRGLPAWMLLAAGAAGVIIIGLIVVVVLLVSRGDDDEPSSADDGAQASASSEPERFSVHGDITLTAYGTGVFAAADGSCVGNGGYNDMQGGAQVVVKDAGGIVLATGALNGGITQGKKYSVCLFAFTVIDVPTGKGPYSVEVGSRGGISFAEEDARNVHLTLGD